MDCIVCGNKCDEFELCTSSIAGYRCSTKAESLSQPLFDLKLDFCSNCFLLSQRQYRDAEKLLDKLYGEHESTQHGSKEASVYFKRFVRSIIETHSLSSESRILEVGCNCGSMLELFRNEVGARVIGVEPSKALLESWLEKDLTVINSYLDQDTSKMLASTGIFDFIYFRHVLEHIPDPIDFVSCVSSLLSDTGVVVVEVPYLLTILEKKRLENVSYSHLRHYCIKSLDALFSQFNLGIERFSLEETDGGSIVVHLKRNLKTDPSYFEEPMIELLKKFLDYQRTLSVQINSLITKYPFGSVIGYGAGAKGQHLIHALKIADVINVVIDDTPGFSGKYLPGTNIRIESREYLDSNNISAVINLAPTHYLAIRSRIPPDIPLIDFINT